MQNRYYVDIRIGCVAVRDRNIHVDSQGLNDEMDGVMFFKIFSFNPRSCPACGHTISSWADGREEIEEATRVCNQLNNIEQNETTYSY